MTHCARHPFEAATGACANCGRAVCGRCAVTATAGGRAVVLCPDCAALVGRDPRPVQQQLATTADGRGGRVTIALIAVNVLALVASVLGAGSLGALAGGGLGGFLGGVTPLLEWGGLVVRPTQYADVDTVLLGVAGGEWYRLATSAFLHFGVLHLAMNMLALWFAGRDLEAALGRARFLALYLLSALGGGVAVLLTGTTAVTAGASGAVFGLFAALVVVLRRLGRGVGSVLPVIVANLVLTFAVPGISIAGHLGGLVTGAVVAFVLTGRRARLGRRSWMLAAAGVLVALVAIAVAAVGLLG